MPWRHDILSSSAPIGVGLIAMLLWGVTKLFNAFARFRCYRLHAGLRYDEGVRHGLDVYGPSGADRAPVIVFFYGGSWQTGRKETYRFLAATLTARGYVVVVPDYGVYPDSVFPAFLKDGAKAVRWTKDHIAAYGGDPERIFVMGHSAGAYIAAMLTVDGRWLSHVGLQPLDDLAGMIGLSGPYDFLPLQDETLKIIFDGANRPCTQPIAYVEGRKPPALLLTGGTDRTVQPRNSVVLADGLRRGDNTAIDVVYDYFGHITILIAFAPFVSRIFPLLTDIGTFVTWVKLTSDGKTAETSSQPAEVLP